MTQKRRAVHLRAAMLSWPALLTSGTRVKFWAEQSAVNLPLRHEQLQLGWPARQLESVRVGAGQLARVAITMRLAWSPSDGILRAVARSPPTLAMSGHEARQLKEHN